MNLESPQFVQKRSFPETQTPPSQPTESQISSPTTKQWSAPTATHFPSVPLSPVTLQSLNGELNLMLLHRLQVQMLWSIIWERPCRLLMWLQFWDWIVTYRVMRFIYLEIVVLLLVWEMEVSKLVAAPVISSRSSSTCIKDGFLLIVTTPGIQAWGI